MASNPPAQCCTIGVKHEGTPTGELKMIGKTEVYMAYPENRATENAVLICPDVIGHEFENAQLIADQFAANGYFTVMVDLFNKDAIPLNRPASFDLQKWIAEGPHLPERIDTVVTEVIQHMRNSLKVQRIAAVGYCFGARYVARFLGATSIASSSAKVDVGYMAHPSFVSAEELRAISGPLSIAAAETDQIFPAEKRHESETILYEKSAGGEKLPYQINLYSGVVHGFAVRGEVTDKRAKYAKEAAFLQAVQWFDEWLKPGKH